MSKGNLFLGFARGKVGDLVFSRQDGAQVTRARNRAPKNPQSPLQLLQRVVMKTTSQAYSMMRDICDHSFQGANQGTPNQSRFAVLNVAALRSTLAEEINSGEAVDILASTKTNFALKGSVLPPVNPYVVSEGTLPSMNAQFSSDYRIILDPLGTGTFTSASATYQDVCNYLGINAGDQLTFIVLTTDDSAAEKAGYFNGFYYARVIMEPSNGDMTQRFAEDGEILMPNAKNEGHIQIFAVTEDGRSKFAYQFAGISDGRGTARAQAGAAVILSRLTGGVWQRSSETINVRGHVGSGELTQNPNVLTLSDAIQSFLSAENSGLYLNQAQG